MANFSAKIQTARDAGYSDEEIKRFLMSTPEAEKAKEAGYTDVEIASHFGLALPEEAEPTSAYDFRSPATKAVSEYVGETLGNIPASTLNFAQGVYETATHPMETTAALGQAAMSPVQTAKAIGGYLGERYASPLETFKQDPVGVLSDISAIAGGVGAGARLAGKGPLSQGAMKLAQQTAPSNVLAGMVQAPFNVAAPTYEFARNMMAPKYAAYMAATEGRTPEIISALRSPQAQIVPGSMPTAAQAAVPVGATKFQALGATAREVMPSEYDLRAEQQAAARLKAMRTVAGSERTLEAAKEGRSKEAAYLYGKADKMLVPEDKKLTELLTRPSMDKALARAEELAAERGHTFQLGETKPATTIESAIVDEYGQPIKRTIPATTAKYPVSSLHALKMSMDDLIRNPERFGIGASEAAAIGNTRKQLISWIKQKSPLYEQARGQFAKRSGPINQMEIGQYLESKLLSALDEEAPQRAGVFATAVEAAPRTIKQSIEGSPRFEKLSDVLTPQQVKTVNDIRADLARAAETDRKARLARESAPDAKEVTKGTIPRAPNLLSKLTTSINLFMNKTQGHIDRKLALEIATEMLDPEQTAKVLEAAVAYAEKTKKTAEKIKGMGAGVKETVQKLGPAISGAVTVQNVMRRRDNQNAMAR
jgi:hypothetical protein